MDKLFILREEINYHQAYRNIAEEKSELAMQAKKYYQDLYETYQKEQCEESNFLDGLEKQWYTRVWELYFATQLKELNFDISCPKAKGHPDLKLIHKEETIWIECTTISKGDNAVVEYEDGEIHTLNDEDYISRITSAIATKNEQINKQIDNGVIGQNDIVIIAINTGELNLAKIAQMDNSLIHKALYGIGNLSYNFKKKESFNSSRFNIESANGSKIKTNLFTTNEYENISGIIFSNWKPTEIHESIKNDFEFTHNLFARNSLENGFFKIGMEYLPFKNNGVGEFEKIGECNKFCVNT
ncbi:hypothetical protein [Candidatus Sulfurimonas baltica]|uniref:Uncharacterized protein n=1 Tax=Candidatus Sulfurimonas baltica TaxID=2740404 RepID=A0A7S7RLX9_9BACT|nr:hypothetical protein [Candidatus Sulfurimonas baltica]QOY50999.1 hypothetical protein HUE88_07550 [Candidatus Sulfurimonas baltica]